MNFWLHLWLLSLGGALGCIVCCNSLGFVVAVFGGRLVAFVVAFLVAFLAGGAPVCLVAFCVAICLLL